MAAAEARYLAGSGEDALRLVAVAERGLLDESQRVRADVLRSRVATMQRRPRDAPLPLLGPAQRLEGFDRGLGRDTYRDAFIAAIYAGRFAGATGLPQVAAAVRSARPFADPPSAADELLDAAALLVDGGYEAGHRRALAGTGLALSLTSTPRSLPKGVQAPASSSGTRVMPSGFRPTPGGPPPGPERPVQNGPEAQSHGDSDAQIAVAAGAWRRCRQR